MSHIFVSYSRSDLDLVGKIIDALHKNNLDTWVDWKGIPKGEDWEREIYRAIEEADVFLFLISPDSVQSQMCNKELEHAVMNGKRILPVLIKQIESRKVSTHLAKLNWIVYREGVDDFQRAIEDIRRTIQTDYAWLKFHTELQLKALKWERVKDASRLLRGKELREAETLIAGVGDKTDPPTTLLQRQYIFESRNYANRQQRWVTFAGAGNIVLILFMASYIVYLSRQLAILKTSSFPSMAPTAQNTEISTPTQIAIPTSTETLIPAATSTPSIVVTNTPILPTPTPENFLRQIYEENRNETSFWAISTLIGLLFTYLIGIGAVLVVWWRFGGEFFSRSWLLRLAAKPLLVTPGLGKWALFLGYSKRLLARPEIGKATNNYFGLPARNSVGDDVLPDEYGNNLHSAIAETLGPQQPVIVVGKGGAGKTTLLSRLAYLAVINQLPNSLKGFRPVFVPSAYYEGNILDTIASVLRKRDGVPLDKDMVQAQLEIGKYLILFDGISEIEGDQAKGMHEILSFAQNSDYRNNRFLLTSRPSLMFPSDLPVFQLNPLTPDVILILLPRYSLGVERERQIHRQLESFGAIPIEPLLFTMILAQDDSNIISVTRSQLYEKYFRRLLRAENDIIWKGWCVILEEFARWFLLDTGSRGVGILHEPLIDLMKEKKSSSAIPKTLLERAQEYYDLPVKSELNILRLLKSAGIIQETRQWRFAHDTFGEYFAAGWILSALERYRNLPNHDQSRNPEQLLSLDRWKINDAQINSFVSVVEFIDEMAEKNTRKLLLESELPIAWQTILDQGNVGENN
jgi:hypothetical protein